MANKFICPTCGGGEHTGCHAGHCEPWHDEQRREDEYQQQKQYEEEMQKEHRK